MSTARLNALPRRRERHFGDRLVWCFAERERNLYAGFARAARQRCDATALVFGEREWTYAQLEQEIARAAASLHALGAVPGTRVAMQLRNGPEFVIVFYAVQRLGAVAVPMDVRLQGPEVAHVVNDSGAALLVHDAELADRAQVAAGQCPHLRTVAASADGPPLPATDAFSPPPFDLVEEEDTAIILYTSGTTGRPKGAAIAHLNVAHSVIHHAGNLGLGADDVSVFAVPISHVTGLLCGVIATLWHGGTLVLLPQFKAKDFLAVAARMRMTYTLMVPAMYNLCLRVEDFDWSSLSAWRLGHFGGAPMPTATIEALALHLPGLTLINGYGATETCSPAVMMPVGEGAGDIRSVGKPLACVELRVVDPETGEQVPTGEAGELWLRGPMVISGYWNDPASTARGIVDGFWRSGDIGSVDSQGFVHVHDRLKDLINRGGYKIYSAEVEAVVMRFPGVLEAAIVGRPDPVLGERVHAFVSAAGHVREEDLAAFCARNLSDYKVPESWTLQAEPLPRNATGKLDKKQLRMNVPIDRRQQT
jgi:O-succinylbenzoic acid--CoA ligase